jgi:hypothetical protein
VAPPCRSGVFGADVSPDAFLPPPPLPNYDKISLEYKDEATPYEVEAGGAGGTTPLLHASGNGEGGGGRGD